MHFDPPEDHKDYLHRSGRTGRAGATGIVVTLLAAEQKAAVKGLQRGLGLPQRLDAPDEVVDVPRRAQPRKMRQLAGRHARLAAETASARRRSGGGRGRAREVDLSSWLPLVAQAANWVDRNISVDSVSVT